MENLPNPPTSPTDFEAVLDILKDDHQSICFSYDLMVELLNDFTPEQKLLFNEVLIYLNAAIKALENAHYDLSDSSFCMFGNKDYRWEPDNEK